MKKLIGAMAFYHEKGMVPAWKLASNFAGKNGRIATLPDIVDARIAQDLNHPVWNTYSTTLSAEYVGIGSDGRLRLIVAHGVGPMSDLDGIMRAYSRSYADKSRRTKGGRITQSEFLALEAGKYGKVEIVDLDGYLPIYQYPFIAPLPEGIEESDLVLRARLGECYQQYVARCRLNSSLWMKERERSPRANCQIISLRDGSVSYWHDARERLEKEGLAFAHLLTVGSLCTTSHSGGESLMHDIDCHDWTDGTRLIGIRGSGKVTEVHPGLRYRKAVTVPESRKALMVKAEEGPLALMSTIQEVTKGVWFTETPRIGASMSTGILEYPVRALEPIGDPVTFRTTIGGYHGFVKYDISEVRAVAPVGANAYRYIDAIIVCEDENPEYHDVLVQFYRADVDTTQRILREDEVAQDASLLEFIVNLYG